MYARVSPMLHVLGIGLVACICHEADMVRGRRLRVEEWVGEVQAGSSGVRCPLPSFVIMPLKGLCPATVPLTPSARFNGGCN